MVADVLREPDVRARASSASPARWPSAASPGLIVPDMPAAEAAELRAACDAAGHRAGPAGRARPRRRTRSREIGATARGFVYVVSVTGVTGERDRAAARAADGRRAGAASAPVPAAVGFGIGTPAQAAAVGEIADGVIIGSRLVRGVADAPTFEAGLEDIRSFLRDSAAG